MRIRAFLLVVPLVLLALLGACSREAGPTPRGSGVEPGPGALRVKLHALTADDCFRVPAEMPPPHCQKYVTQLASVPETVAGFESAGPRLNEAAGELTAGIKAYRRHSCAGEGAGDECSKALADIAKALADVRDGVAGLPGTGSS